MNKLRIEQSTIHPDGGVTIDATYHWSWEDLHAGLRSAAAESDRSPFTDERIRFWTVDFGGLGFADYVQTHQLYDVDPRQTSKGEPCRWVWDTQGLVVDLPLVDGDFPKEPEFTPEQHEEMRVLVGMSENLLISLLDRPVTAERIQFECNAVAEIMQRIAEMKPT